MASFSQKFLKIPLKEDPNSTQTTEPTLTSKVNDLFSLTTSSLIQSDASSKENINLTDQTELSNADWSSVKWNHYQNNIVAFKDYPDSLLAYVVTARSKTNIKVCKTDGNFSCKTIIKGFTKDIIEVNWNACYFDSQHRNILSALTNSGTLFIYEISCFENEKKQTSLRHTTLAVFNCLDLPLGSPSKSLANNHCKIEVYDEAHSFILLLCNNTVHLIDLYEYIDFQRKQLSLKNGDSNPKNSNSQNFQEKSSIEEDLSALTYQFHSGNSVDSDDENSDAENTACDGEWVNELEEKLSPQIVTSHLLKSNVTRIYDAALAPTGEYLALSDNLGRLTFWNVEENSMAHNFTPYEDLECELNQYQLSNKNVSFIGFVDGPDSLMWQY